LAAELGGVDEEEGLRQLKKKKGAKALTLISKTKRFGPKAHFRFKIIKTLKFKLKILKV